MNFKPMLLAAALAAVCCSAAHAAATPEEIARLGKDLTPWGAEVAGNKDGSIPAYTGGLRNAPANFKPNSGRWADPFPNEKPLFSITAANYTQYDDKLLGSAKEMFKRFPKTFRVDVYPSHRTVWLPDWVNENSIKNASTAKIASDGSSLTGAFGGTPFPIPKTGIEAWWNWEVRYKGTYQENNVSTWQVDGAGNKSLDGSFNSYLYFPNFDPNIGREKFLASDGLYYKVYNDYSAPAGRVGEVSLYHTWYNQNQYPAKGWSYTTGQRRVRTTPDLFYDTPCPGYNGGITMDDIQMTYGPQDRFDWKLIGKKEIYIPYNNYKQQYETPSAPQLTPNHPNPDSVRWELHRVWVLEGTPKAGVRHIYSKKIVYTDEDMGGGQMEAFDHSGKIFRAGWSTTVPMYDLGIPYTFGNWFFDFSTGSYFMGSHPGDTDVKGIFFPPKKDWNLRRFTPEYVQANGVR